MGIIAIKNEDHWRELRAHNVGGSEIAALFNACSYLTHLELWLSKRGEISGEIEDTTRMFWGRMIEDAVARGVESEKGWSISNPRTYYTCDDTPGMACTPDRIACKAGSDVLGLLQIKNVDRLIFMKWEDGQPPLQYQLQLQHELACTGLVWGAIAVLVGGNDLKVFEYDAHPGAIARIKDAVRNFWGSVRSGHQPKAVADDYEILKELYPESQRLVDLSADNELPELCATALIAAERRKDAEKEEKAAKAAVLQKMGDAGRALCSGFIIKKTIISKKEYLVKATSYQQLTITEEKEKAA